MCSWCHGRHSAAFTEHANETWYLDRPSSELKHKDIPCRLDAGYESGAFCPQQLPVHVSPDDLMLLPLFTLPGCWTQKKRTVRVSL